MLTKELSGERQCRTVDKIVADAARASWELQACGHMNRYVIHAIPGSVTCMQCRMESAESRLSAVSEVVRTLKLALIPLAALVVSGECVAATTALSEELKLAIFEAHDASLTAITNHEKAQKDILNTDVAKQEEA